MAPHIICTYFVFETKTFLSKEKIKSVPFQQTYLLLVGVLTRTLFVGPMTQDWTLLAHV